MLYHTCLNGRFKRCRILIHCSDVTVVSNHQSHICQKQATTFLRHFEDFLAVAEFLTNGPTCINVREDKRYQPDIRD